MTMDRPDYDLESSDHRNAVRKDAETSRSTLTFEALKAEIGGQLAKSERIPGRGDKLDLYGMHQGAPVSDRGDKTSQAPEKNPSGESGKPSKPENKNEADNKGGKDNAEEGKGKAEKGGDKTDKGEKPGPKEPAKEAGESECYRRFNDRNRYQQDAIAMAKEASLSPPVQAGEGYYQVAKRMYPGMPEADLQALSGEMFKLNGGRRPLHRGERIKVMSEEQQMRLVDQVMNGYDEKHKTSDLDRYGDFGPEKGKMSKMHEAIRAEKCKQMSEVLDKKHSKPEPEKKPAPEPETKKPEEKKPSLPLMQMNDFASTAKDLFPKLDINNDGVLNRQELFSASMDKTYTPVEAQAIEGLLANEVGIRGLSNDQFFREKGISFKDLTKMGELIEGSHVSYDDAANAKKYFGPIESFSPVDKDHDGFLSKKELKESLLNKDLSAEQKAAVQTLLENYKKVMKVANDESGFENDGISRYDILGVCDQVKGSKDGKLISSIGRAIFAEYEEQQRQANSAPAEKPVETPAKPGKSEPGEKVPEQRATLEEQGKRAS